MRAVRNEHRPLLVRRAQRALERAYAKHFVEPHFDAVGEGCGFQGARYIHAFGSPITLGKHVQLCGLRDNPTRLTVWGAEKGLGSIHIGDYAVINPGARINAGCRVEIGKNALFAGDVTLSDTDWHGYYDRVNDHGGYAPIIIEENVWLGEGVRVGKGVTIGKNSIVGAGSIVVRDIPANCVAVGNPARVVRELDPNAEFFSRSDLLRDPETLFGGLEAMEREMLKDKTLLGYLRYLLFPKRSD